MGGWFGSGYSTQGGSSSDGIFTSLENLGNQLYSYATGTTVPAVGGGSYQSGTFTSGVGGGSGLLLIGAAVLVAILVLR